MNRFGDGYTCEIKAAESHVAGVVSFMNETFPAARLLEQAAGTMKFHVPRTRSAKVGVGGDDVNGVVDDVDGDANKIRKGTGSDDGDSGAGDDFSLAAIFAEIEAAKERLCIEDYSLSQTSLEQIFLRMAVGQRFDPLQQE
jgi:hypothetical protein